MADRVTETEEVVANPDGTFTWTQSRHPVRVRQGGQWRPTDLTLAHRPDGSIGPVAASVDLRLSRGGADMPLVVAAKQGHEVGLRWADALPEPVLDGPSATYPGVLPEVDLVVTALPTGFSQVLVVKRPRRRETRSWSESPSARTSGTPR
ncbi:hypothetical protein [Amycolatopsis aidingensis]|uniref:hypothetical protein n=1 Tax=Amycolatopsis aidingensis TaxID=2842453 RepID=UPI001E4D9E2E|nr:hypothetical protein [Amycolatopsis aidingensis]